MRQGPNSRRSRGRGSNNPGRRSNLPNRNQTFDSNGPDIRIRGNAHQVYEKYLALARDASAAGDRVMGENYLQHAEHYHRIINAMNESFAQAQQQQFDGQNRDQGDRDDGREPAPNGRDNRREAGGRDPQDQRGNRAPREGGRRDQGYGSDLFEDPRQDEDQEFQSQDEGPERRRSHDEGPGRRRHAGNGRDHDRGRDRGEQARENDQPANRTDDDDRRGLERIIRAPAAQPAPQAAEEVTPAQADAPAAEEAPKPRRRPGRPRKVAAPVEPGGEPAE